MSIKKQMCDILAEKRVEQRITYKEISELTGLASNQLVWIFKQGGNKVSLDKVELVAKVLGVTFEVAVASYSPKEPWNR